MVTQYSTEINSNLNFSQIWMMELLEISHTVSNVKMNNSLL